MKVYSWKTLLITLFGGGAILIYAIYDVYRGHMLLFNMLWIVYSGYLIFQGLKASLTEEGAAKDAANKKMDDRVYRKLFGGFGPVMPWGMPILIIAAIAFALVIPEHWWVCPCFLLAAFLYQIWLFFKVRGEREKMLLEE